MSESINSVRKKAGLPPWEDAIREPTEKDRIREFAGEILRRAKDVAMFLPQLEHVHPSNLAFLDWKVTPKGWSVIFFVYTSEQPWVKVIYDVKTEQFAARIITREDAMAEKKAEKKEKKKVEPDVEVLKGALYDPIDKPIPTKDKKEEGK